MLTFRVLSVLLSYPRPELKAEVGQAEKILRSEGILTGSQLENVCAVLKQVQLTPQLEAESCYIEAFDCGRSTSLYLFEHIHGESRDRGQAMVRLLNRYRMHGLDLHANELPDFLPLFLEFISTCRPEQGCKYLAEVVDIIVMIGRRLSRRGTLYAPLFEAIASLVVPDAADGAPASEGSRDDDRDDTPAALDAAWEESPVTFDDAALNAVQGQIDATSGGRQRPRRT